MLHFGYSGFDQRPRCLASPSCWLRRTSPPSTTTDSARSSSKLVQSGGAGQVPCAELRCCTRSTTPQRGRLSRSFRRGQVLRDRRSGLRLDPHVEPLQGIGASPEGAQLAQVAIDKSRKKAQDPARCVTTVEAVAGLLRDFANPHRARTPARRAKLTRPPRQVPGWTTRRRSSTRSPRSTQTASDQTYSAYLKAAGILEKQFAKHPDIRASRTISSTAIRTRRSRRKA